MSDDDDVCPECNARGTDKIEGITYCINGHQLVITPNSKADWAIESNKWCRLVKKLAKMMMNTIKEGRRYLDRKRKYRKRKFPKVSAAYGL